MNEREGRGRRPAIRCRSFWPGGIHKIRYDCCWDELGWKERGREIGRNMFSSVSFLSGLSVSTSDPLELRWQKNSSSYILMDYTSQWCSDQSFRISGLKTGLWPCPKWGEIKRASSYIGNLPLALWRIRNSNGGGGAQSREGGETPVTGGHVEDEIPYLESGRRRRRWRSSSPLSHSLSLSPCLTDEMVGLRTSYTLLAIK